MLRARRLARGACRRGGGDVHHGVRKAHFAPVDNTISNTLQHSKEGVVLWVEKKLIESFLDVRRIRSANSPIP